MATLQGTGITGVSDYLVNTLLPTVTSLRTANIFNHELTDLAGFPSATVTPGQVISKVLDNHRNQITQRFTIRVFIDRSKANFGSSKAETILRSLADEISQVLQSNPTLGGNCIDSKPFDAKFGYIDRESNNIRVIEVELDCFDAITWR